MDLTPEQINEFLSNAILKSSIGKAVEDSVNRSIAELSRGYNNPFDAVIRREVESLISEHLRTTFSEQLRGRVRVALESKLTEDTVNSIIEAGINMLLRERNR